MPADTASRITSIWKPHRPAPADYLPENRTREHLELFKGGAARVMVATTLEDKGPGQIDGTSFVLPAWQVDELLAYANGDRGRLEDALGWERGGLGKGKLVVVTIPQPEKFNLRFPSGNEAGANKDWIPGGRLPPTAASQGLLEAILDLGGVKEGEDWTKTPLRL
jgi:hypothetical protein